MTGRRMRHRFPAAAAVALLIAVLTPGEALAARGTIHITKIDGRQRPIEGATFQVFHDDAPKGPPRGPEDVRPAGTCTTGANGQCSIRVPTGSYWLSETGPPDGFTPVPDQHVKITTKRRTRELVLENEKTPKNVRVNSPTGDDTQGDGTNRTQTGPVGATDPTGQNIVVAYNDSTGFAAPPFSFTGWSTSTDGGRTFTDRGEVPTGSANGVVFGQPFLMFDPVLDDRVLMANSFCNFGTTTTCPIVVSRSTDNGQTWGSPVPVNPNVAPGKFSHTPDFDFDADPFSPTFGRIYMFWGESDEMTLTSRIWTSHSDDFGATWSIEEPVSDTAHFDFPDVAVGANGDVHAVFSSFESGDVRQNQYFHVRSTDGGQTFTAPTAITGVLPPSGALKDCDGQMRPVLFDSFAAQDPPRLGVSPSDPNALFVAFGGHGTGSDPADIFVSRSTDGGTTWTTAEPILPTIGEQFFPSVSVAPDGTIGTFFYDGRFRGPLIDVTGTFGMFDGTHLGTTRLTRQGFSLWQMNPPFDSVYNSCFGFDPFRGAVNDDGFFVPWTDGRNPGPPGNNGIDPNVFSAVHDTCAFATCP